MYNKDTIAAYSDGILMDFLFDMRTSMEGRSRLKYVDVVLESVSSESGRAFIMNKLFADMQKINDIDFGKIENSKGDITKYAYYQQLVDCIDSLSEITEYKSIENIETLKKLHEVILAAAPDFMFGFKTDNFILRSAYKLMVASLYELIQICTVDCTGYLREKLGVKEPTKYINSDNSSLLKNAKRFIKQYESGEWSLIMKVFKQNPQAAKLGVATEGLGDIANDVLGALSSGSGLTKELSSSTVSKRLVEWFSNIFNKTPIGIKVIGSIFALVLILRSMIFYFFSASFNIGNWAKTNATILRATIDADRSAPGVEKQKKMLDKLDSVSDVISYKVFKTEKVANAELVKSNKENLSTDLVVSAIGAEFEL